MDRNDYYTSNKRATDNTISSLEWKITDIQKEKKKLEDEVACLKAENAKLKDKLQKISNLVNDKTESRQSKLEYSPVYGYR